MKHNVSNLKVSNTTANFINALDALEGTQERFYNALVELYGEEDGSKFYNDNLNIFDETRTAIAEFMLRSITDNLTNKDVEDTI